MTRTSAVVNRPFNPLDAAPTEAADLGLIGEDLVAFVDGGPAAAGFFFGDEDEETEADAGRVPFLLGVKRPLEDAVRPDGEKPAASPGGALGAVPPADPAPQAGEMGAMNRPAVETPAAEARPADPAVPLPAAVLAGTEPVGGPDVIPEAAAFAPAPETPVPDGGWSAAEVADAVESAETLPSWARVPGGLALARRGRPGAEVARRPPRRSDRRLTTGSPGSGARPPQHDRRQGAVPRGAVGERTELTGRAATGAGLPAPPGA